MNLYELSTAYQQIQTMIEDGQEGLEDTLESLNDAIEDKAVGYAKVMKNLEAQANAIKDEEKRLAERRKSLENNIKRLKDSLEAAMISSDMKRIKTELFSFNIQKNPPSVFVRSEKSIPEEYFIPQEPKLDKKALLADLKEGKEVPGVEIRQSEGLRIR
ncbi:siphovirus Gp157 family protein [Siminovitchia fortis]|uniref:Siphovirus Gp157 family protein n=1 Tax=Siminovitchia fortis TaxID=254758 RepID=A0A443IM32_9BACI|nr:siphovirus Gp157 family protein [Siminovitchia fortis]RWR06715.1 siphovirus Gp157 family protein [Siminovitchia fortis]WHY82979.1 siphovirus Gp157 family protein [Siminovitchia fortis]